MRKTVLTVLALAAAGLAFGGAAQARSTWDGVYTDAQAERGHTLYMQNCSRCHGANLWGTYEVPSLLGRTVHFYSGSTLDVLFEYISTAMPLGRPGSLSPATNADIVAYILKANGFPSGSAELTAGGLKAVNFDATRRAKRK